MHGTVAEGIAMPEAASAAKDVVHFFVSRAGADAGFAAVIGKILEDAGYRVILQDWDFADKNFMDRMNDALNRAGRVIVLLSPEYLASPYCTAEWVNAMAGDPLNRSGRLMIFRVKECTPTGLLAGLAYRDLLPLRDHATRLRDYVLDAVKKDKPRTAPDHFFIPARTVLHDRIRDVPNFTGRQEDSGRARPHALERQAGRHHARGLAWRRRRRQIHARHPIRLSEPRALCGRVVARRGHTGRHRGRARGAGRDLHSGP